MSAATATRLLRPAVFGLFVVLVLPPARADQDRVSRANYKLANQYSKAYVRQFVYDTAVTPHWIGKTDSFWYSFRTSQGTNYYRVHQKLKTKEPLFDRTRLGMLLSELTHKPLDPLALPLTRLTLNDEGTKLKFVVEDPEPPAATDETPKTGKGKGNRGGGRGAPGEAPRPRRGTQFEYDLTTEKLNKLGPAPLAPAGPGDFPFTGRGGGQFGGGRGLFTNQQTQQDTQRQDQQQRQDQDKTDQDKGDPQQQKGRGRRGGGQGTGYQNGNG